MSPFDASSGAIAWSQSLGHIGYVVPDLERGIEHLTAMFGLRWASIQERTADLRLAGGLVRRDDFRFTWSLDGPVHLEVFEEAPGTVWTRSDGNPIHHLSYWVADLHDEAARLRANGFELEVTRIGEQEVNGFGYFIGPDGLRVEPKPESARAALDVWLAGGEFA